MPPECDRLYASVLGREDSAERQCLNPRCLSTIDMPKAFAAKSIVTSGLRASRASQVGMHSCHWAAIKAMIMASPKPLISYARTVENKVFLKFSAKARSRSTLETSHAPWRPVTIKSATSSTISFFGSSPAFTAAFRQ